MTNIKVVAMLLYSITYLLAYLSSYSRYRSFYMYVNMTR